MSFDTDLCARYVESLIRHDEIERALLVLENVPAQYRMFPEPKLLKLREEMLSKAMTVSHVSEEAPRLAATEESALGHFEKLHRAGLIAKEVKTLNEKGIVPHLIDFGPGVYFIPFGLKALGMKFTYLDIAVQKAAQEIARPLLKDHLHESAPKDRPILFIAFEVIEHLHEPRDLAIEAVRAGHRTPDIIFMSTPYCTYRVMEPDEDWRKWNLEHLRAYTPDEFLTESNRIFPGFQWTLHCPEKLYVEPMAIVGRKYL